MYWCSEEFDRLHFAALKELDEAKRHDMYIQMQQLWDEAVHTQWIYWPTLYFAARKGVTPSIYPTAYLHVPAFTVEA
jgi:ABC-type transport system substrate-binding protein